MKKNKSASRSKSGIKQTLWGAFVIWCVFVFLSLVFAIALFSGDDPTGSYALFSLIAFILSGAIGTVLNRRIFGKNDKSIPIYAAFLSAVFYLITATVVSGGISLGTLISAACFIGSASLVCMPKKKRKIHRH